MAALQGQCFLWIFMFALLTIGHVDANSRALRKLNKQFNLLRRSVERDIEDLTYEVTDLHTQLELERERASTLAELLNSTDLSLSGGYSTSSKNLLDKYSTLEKEVNKLKKENKQLKKLAETAESHGREIADARRDIRALNDSATKLADAAGSKNKPFVELKSKLSESVEDAVNAIERAFGDEKRKLRDVKVGNLTGALRSEIDTIRDVVDEVKRATGLNKDKLEVWADCCKVPS